MELREFATRINKIAAEIPANANKGIKDVAGAVVTTVVNNTPVDEGTAASNWQVGLGSAPTGTIPAYSRGKHGDTAGANRKTAIDTAHNTIAQYRGNKPIHIANNLDYIGKLNDGASAQAPAGFVQTAVLTALSKIKGIRLISKA